MVERCLRPRDDGSGEDAWPFGESCHRMLNPAVGGAWGERRGIDGSALPAELLVDDVRVNR